MLLLFYFVSVSFRIYFPNFFSFVLSRCFGPFGGNRYRRPEILRQCGRGRPNNGQLGVSCDDSWNRSKAKKKEAKRKQRMRMSGSETDPLMLFRPVWDDRNKRYLKPAMAPVETARKLKHQAPILKP